MVASLTFYGRFVPDHHYIPVMPLLSLPNM
jgi:hypothetical protein